MNLELFKKALEKVKNPNILVNVVSKRVRQLNSVGAASRPLVSDTANLSPVDIALREIIEDKLSYELPLSTEVLVGSGASTPPATSTGRRRRKS
jgi:DNA-directed RNA polymerase subunit omega